MNTYDFVQLSLLALGGGVQGRTKLQKSVYFLGLLTGELEELGYRPHYYGPYSAEVSAAVDKLRALGFAQQSIASAGAYDPSGFEVSRFDYVLTPEGKEIAEAKAQKQPELWQKIRRGAELFQKVKNRDYIKLSIAAKTYFMLGQRKGTARIEELSKLAGRFGWAVTPAQVREAASILQDLKLVEIRD